MYTDMSRPINVKLLNRIIHKFTERITTIYSKHFRIDAHDFNSTRSQSEINIIINCIHLMENNLAERYSKKIIYTVIMFFYYSTNVLEYYVSLNSKHFIVKQNRVEFKELLLKIMASDEQWCSNIRRLIYNF